MNELMTFAAIIFILVVVSIFISAFINVKKQPLEKIDKYSILKLTYEHAAAYAQQSFASSVNIGCFDKKYILDFNEYDTDSFEAFTVESVGNLAYVWCWHENELVAEKARKILLNYRQYCIDKKYIHV